MANEKSISVSATPAQLRLMIASAIDALLSDLGDSEETVTITLTPGPIGARRALELPYDPSALRDLLIQIAKSAGITEPTNKVLAQALNIDPGFLSRVMNGKGRLTKKRARAIYDRMAHKGASSKLLDKLLILIDS